MPLDLPNLDDRTYQDLVDEALSLIPTYAPEWTNFNPSDPGITLIELFAYLSEMLIYRLNRVSDANRQAFLNLIVGLKNPKTGEQQYPLSEPLSREDLNDKLREAIQALRESKRAVTCEDFENLALNAHKINDKHKNESFYIEGDLKVARAKCIPGHNLSFTSYGDSSERAGHISLVIVETKSTRREETTTLIQTQILKDNLTKFLDNYRLLTTKIHVVAADYVPISINLTLVLHEDAEEEETLVEATKELTTFFDVTKWSFGANVYLSDIYELLDKVKGVDYVEKTEGKQQLITNLEKRYIYIKENSNSLIGISLHPNELVVIGQIDLIPQ